MSQSREDYIKFIYENGKGEYVSNKSIAVGLGIAPPSVSEMISKLSAEHLVDYRPYHGATLTTAGEKMAVDLIRKHEIWEYFLETKLNYTKEEVHQLAEILEHVTPIDLANRLANYINYPEK
ncbi:metal-dependent transcriptional regulator [Fundicoccus sp. Sow4_H7]|uniref:metal-dependent transcriptional regulator n=1 Tax=Fundicoccus sp. Sow4_H7 TaxID=3438784 RepID=UPI003F8E880A